MIALTFCTSNAVAVKLGYKPTFGEADQGLAVSKLMQTGADLDAEMQTQTEAGVEADAEADTEADAEAETESGTLSEAWA